MKTHIDYESESDRRTWWLNNTGGAAKENLTVRDYFAAKAMGSSFYPAIMEALRVDSDLDCDLVAGFAYTMADAMMEARALDKQGEL